MRKFLIPAVSFAVLIPALAVMFFVGNGTPAAMAHVATHQSVPLAAHIHQGKNSTSSN